MSTLNKASAGIVTLKIEGGDPGEAFFEKPEVRDALENLVVACAVNFVVLEGLRFGSVPPKGIEDKIQALVDVLTNGKTNPTD